VPAAGDLTATDNCSPDITATGVDTDNGGGGCSGDPLIITRTWTFADACGNSSTATQTITVEDTIDPVAPSAPADASYQCPSEAATDNCSPDITATGVATDNGGGGCAGDPLVITRTWTFTDDCGNSSSVDQTITVLDDTPPVPDPAPADASYQCLSEVPAAGDLTATDNCSPDITSTGVDTDNGGSGCPGDPLVITRTWTFADDCDNPASVSQTITVVDDTPPVLSCPPDIQVNADDYLDCEASIVVGTATATDNCDAAPVVVADYTGTMFPVGSTTVTWTATDVCGNTTTCTQMVTVLGQVCASKFYDANFDGVQQAGEEFLTGWRIDVLDTNDNLVAFGHTDQNGNVCFDLPAGVYKVVEVVPPAPENNWQVTTGATQQVTIDDTSCSPSVTFGNYCFEAPSGGHTIGFWRNKNGKDLLKQNDPAWRVLVNSLGLRNQDGTLYTVDESAKFRDAYLSFREYLMPNNNTAVAFGQSNVENMAYLLSIQLAVTSLSEAYVGLDPDKGIIVPGGAATGNGVCIVPLLSTDQPLACGSPPIMTLTNVPGSTSCGCSSNDGLTTFGDLQALAICLLQNFSDPAPGTLARDYLESVKNILDMIAKNGGGGYPCGGLTQYVDIDGTPCQFTAELLAGAKGSRPAAAPLRDTLRRREYGSSSGGAPVSWCGQRWVGGLTCSCQSASVDRP